jgi:SMODS and SLOG-associating 2TM effector domain family 5
MSEIEFLTRLRFTAWRTMGARFNAARRLKRRDIIGAVSIAVFAMIGVGLAIVQPIYEIKPGNLDNFLTALSVLLGMFVVAISLIEWGYQGGHKAEVLYRTGEELTEFHRKLDQILSTSKDAGDVKSEN